MKPSLVPLCLSLALGACVGGPPQRIVAAPPDLPASFAFAPDAATGANFAALLPTADPAYLDIRNAALSSAPTLAQAAARIDAARAGLSRAGAERLPNIAADASVAATRTSPDQVGSGFPPGISIDTERTRFGANLTATWDLDLFGRLRALDDAAAARLDAARFEAAGVRNVLLAEIAGSVIDWRTIAARQAALESDLAAAEDLARLAAVRERAGIAPGFDRVRAEGVAETSRSRIATLASERARVAGRLVTLTGLSAQQILAFLAQPAPDMGQPPAPVAVPSQLLANRPDVLAAAAALAAEDAELAATAARRFPQLTLSGVLGLLAFDLGSLFDNDAIVGSAGGSLLAPLLDFGRIKADIAGAEAETRLAFASYSRAVFTSLGDAESAFGLVAAADRELAATQREAAITSRSARLAQTRFRAGLSDFLTVLDARRSADASSERSVSARGRALRARVLLWQALGGEPFVRAPHGSSPIG